MVNIVNSQIRKKFIDALLICAVTAGLGWAGVARAAAQSKGKKTAKPASKPAAKSSAAKSEPSVRSTEGLRDPFKLPAPPSTNPAGDTIDMATIGPLPPGSRGLIIGQLKLEGIVRQGKDKPKMIAVLANPANRAYFLHENDPLYNGVITKITPDSVYFQEEVRDASGKTTSREVIKKLPPASGEKK